MGHHTKEESLHAGLDKYNGTQTELFHMKWFNRLMSLGSA